MWFIIATFFFGFPLSDGHLLQPNNEDHIRFYRLYYAPFEVPAPIPSTRNVTEITANPERHVLCPDKRATCDDQDTCCLTTQGRYGCCPLPHAVCCSDKLHCCPHGMRCDVRHNRCIEKDGQTTLEAGSPMTRLIVEYESPAEQNGPYAEGQSKEPTCPESSTPCQSKQTIACCPMENGVCCPDGLHCCPTGYRCAVDKCQLDERSPSLFILAALRA
uniref:Granulins domain-containing protein n=1 Tax=Trichuris muris TaxID=70415 RepID=A0A5S6QDD0_TRIMR